MQGLERGCALAIVFLVWMVLGCTHDKAQTPSEGSAPAATQAPPHSAAFNAQPSGPGMQIDPAAAMKYTREIVSIGPRWVGGQGQEKMAAYLRARLKNDGLEEDAFTTDTPAGKKSIRNLIAKFPGTREGVIVLASHIDTNYPLRDTKYAGANDGASSTGLLLAIADRLRGKKLEGFSVWLAFLDGEEAFVNWSDTDSIYGSRHLAEKWQGDGTLGKLKAFILADMIGDADLNIERDSNSTPWLQDMVLQAAVRLGYQSHFYERDLGIEDDHLPFVRRGVPVIDMIDIDYGYQNSYHHTTEDTLDKLSPKSLQITGDVILETIRLLNANGDNLPKEAPSSGSVGRRLPS